VEKPMDNNVCIVDVKIPFLSMVVILVKLVLAAIPAILIAMFIAVIFLAAFGSLLERFH
jgi:hypothetical protein